MVAAATLSGTEDGQRFSLPGGGTMTVHHGTLVTCSDDVAFALLSRVASTRPGTLLDAGGDLRGARQAYVAPGRVAECRAAVDNLLDPASKKMGKTRAAAAKDDGSSDDGVDLDDY